MNALAEILEQRRDDAATFGPGFANHLPMAATALVAIGAPDERVRTYATWYASARGLVPMDSAERARRDAVLARTQDLAPEAALANELPALAGDPGAAAFHGLIRTAYAFDSRSPVELANALAAWEAASQAPDARASEPATVDAREALDRLTRAAAQIDPGPARGFITTRTARVASHPAFASVADVAPHGDALDALALAAGAAFARRGDFVALHVMTGTAAMQRLLPLFGAARERALAAFWRAYAAAGIASGTPPALDPVELASLREQAPPAWRPLLAAAIAQDDDHTIKATATAYALDARLNDPVFRTAAQRYLRSAASV